MVSEYEIDFPMEEEKAKRIMRFFDDPYFIHYEGGRIYFLVYDEGWHGRMYHTLVTHGGHDYVLSVSGMDDTPPEYYRAYDVDNDQEAPYDTVWSWLIDRSH